MRGDNEMIKYDWNNVTNETINRYILPDDIDCAYSENANQIEVVNNQRSANISSEDIARVWDL